MWSSDDVKVLQKSANGFQNREKYDCLPNECDNVEGWRVTVIAKELHQSMKNTGGDFREFDSSHMNQLD